MNEIIFKQEKDQNKRIKNSDIKKLYRAPNLEKLGDLRSLTLGGSPGTGDSGAGLYVERPFGT